MGSIPIGAIPQVFFTQPAAKKRRSKPNSPILIALLNTTRAGGGHRLSKQREQGATLLVLAPTVGPVRHLVQLLHVLGSSFTPTL